MFVFVVVVASPGLIHGGSSPSFRKFDASIGLVHKLRGFVFVADDDGVPPLHKAVANNHIDIVKLLLDREDLQVPEFF